MTTSICSLFSSRALPAPSFPGEDFRFRITGSTGAGVTAHAADSTSATIAGHTGAAVTTDTADAADPADAAVTAGTAIGQN
jgi:hypothetical protein